MPKPIITLLSDFGSASGYPAQMKGVILGLVEDVHLVDISHQVAPYQVLMGQVLLRDAVAAFPRGTIHLAVVDPGVGTSRRALVVAGGGRAEGHLFVGPDNGLLTPFARTGSVFETVNPELRRETVSHTFHGRDVFAPAAAHLARGVPPEQFGPRVDDWVRLAPPRVRHEGGSVVGEIIFSDPFGNLVTNIAREDLPEAPKLRVAVAGRTLAPFKQTFGEVPAGEPVAVLGSSGYLEIAVREGSAARLLGLDPAQGMPVVVEPA